MKDTTRTEKHDTAKPSNAAVVIRYNYVVQQLTMQHWYDLSPNHKTIEDAQEHIEAIIDEAENGKWQGAWRIIKREIVETEIKRISIKPIVNPQKIADNGKG